MAFTYSLINTAVSILVCFMGMVLIEYLGRRPVLISGAFFQSLWLYLVAGIGGSATTADRQKMMVAAFMLFNFSFSYSWAPL
jgi:MFS transporter, SP family, sugar:H+ symporter